MLHLPGSKISQCCVCQEICKVDIQKIQVPQVFQRFFSEIKIASSKPVYPIATRNQSHVDQTWWSALSQKRLLQEQQMRNTQFSALKNPFGFLFLQKCDCLKTKVRDLAKIQDNSAHCMSGLGPQCFNNENELSHRSFFRKSVPNPSFLTAKNQGLTTMLRIGKLKKYWPESLLALLDLALLQTVHVFFRTSQSLRNFRGSSCYLIFATATSHAIKTACPAIPCFFRANSGGRAIDHLILQSFTNRKLPTDFL